MKVSIKKWGNSASLRIPSVIMRAAGLDIDQAIDIREEDGRIIIEPLPEKEFELSAMLSQITKDNIHDETDFGSASGKEIW